MSKHRTMRQIIPVLPARYMYSKFLFTFGYFLWREIISTQALELDVLFMNLERERKKKLSITSPKYFI